MHARRFVRFFKQARDMTGIWLGFLCFAIAGLKLATMYDGVAGTIVRVVCSVALGVAVYVCMEFTDRRYQYYLCLHGYPADREPYANYNLRAGKSEPVKYLYYR